MQNYFNGILIFRTTLHGHPNCIYYSKPWNYSQLLHEKSQPMKYNWHMFDSIDNAIIEELKHVYKINGYIKKDVRLMNVTFTAPMAIGHPSISDCFHTCAPSALMYWWNVQLFSTITHQSSII